MATQSRKVTIGVLITVIIILVGIALYMTLSYTATPEPERTTQKVKAEGETFNKVVVLNSQPTAAPESTGQTSLTLTPEPTAVELAKAPNATPTEIVIGYQNPTVTISLIETISPVASGSGVKNGTPSATITKMQSLPKTGILTNSLIVVGAAFMMIVLSFVF